MMMMICGEEEEEEGMSLVNNLSLPLPVSIMIAESTGSSPRKEPRRDDRQ